MLTNRIFDDGSAWLLDARSPSHETPLRPHRRQYERLKPLLSGKLGTPAARIINAQEPDAEWLMLGCSTRRC